jgi:hypothetical protein
MVLIVSVDDGAEEGRKGGRGEGAIVSKMIIQVQT